MISGLRELKTDERDFQVGAFYSLPTDIPDSFSLGTGWIEDQEKALEDDFCSAYASCGASELQEGVKLSRRYSFALSKKLSGDPEEWGQDLRTAIKVHTKFGALEEKELNETELLMDSTRARYIHNYRDELIDKLFIHKKKTYFKINSFDEAKGMMWKFKDKKQAIVSGVKWGWSIFDYELKGMPEGMGHAIYYTGVQGDYLELVNSLGLRAGHNGIHLIHKDTVDYYIKKFGGFMMVDESPEYVKWAMEHNIKEKDNFVVKLFKVIISLFKKQ